MSKIYDVIVLGAGPAGLAAGLYAGRSRLSVLIVEKGQDGGQISITDEIENYPGQIVDQPESGPSLIARMTEQAKKFGAERVSDTIKEVSLEGDVKVLKGEKGEYQAKNIIIATGAHANIKDIRPFLKYFNDLVATEVYNDVLFLSERNENVWWYDGERIAFRTPNYTKILNAMRTQSTLTLADMKEETGISVTAIQKLLNQLISKKYVERGEKDGSWRVFVTQ